MFTLSIKHDPDKAGPEATLKVPLNFFDQLYLSIACRAARNRTALYQKKHRGSAMATRERDWELAALNRPIAEHYRSIEQQAGSLKDRRVLAFPISDLTANPLRPHYHASPAEVRAAFENAPSAGAVFQASDARLFFLEDEPIGKVPYTLLLVYEAGGATRLAIRHSVCVAADGALPVDVPEPILKGLRWWAACPPLLINGEHKVDEYAIRDYDLRHVFGFPEKGSPEEGQLREMFQCFPHWDEWRRHIHKKLESLKAPAAGYHAALGLSDQEMILVHRVGTIPEIAASLKSLGARDAVLLDSGGSCAIWANWVDGGQGGILANHWNFRPPRGAVAFLVLRDQRPH
jgi:hypothetical protein